MRLEHEPPDRGERCVDVIVGNAERAGIETPMLEIGPNAFDERLLASEARLGVAQKYGDAHRLFELRLRVRATWELRGVRPFAADLVGAFIAKPEIRHDGCVGRRRGRYAAIVHGSRPPARSIVFPCTTSRSPGRPRPTRLRYPSRC